MESIDKQKLTYFQCKNQSGNIQPGKKHEIVFEFTPRELGNFEEFYLFSSDQSTVKTAFLIAGMCREPRVYFKQCHVIIDPTILFQPKSTTVALKNEDDIQLTYAFEKVTLINNNQHLDVNPIKGIIFPKSETNIE